MVLGGGGVRAVSGLIRVCDKLCDVVLLAICMRFYVVVTRFE